MIEDLDVVGGYLDLEDFDSGFLMLPNSTAQDQNLTPAALGLLAFVCSLPPGWVVRDGYLQAHFGIGRDALRTIYRSLEPAGYARRRHSIRQPNGRFATVTSIRRKPIFLLDSDRGRFSACGSSTDGEPTTLKRHIKK